MSLEHFVIVTSLIGNALSIFLSGVAIWHMRAYLKEKVRQNLKNLKEKL